VSAKFNGTPEELAQLTHAALRASRDESKKVRDAEQLVLTKAVEFAEALDLYQLFWGMGFGDNDEVLFRAGVARDSLRAAVAALKAAEAAA
jgi:hypothetical protein